MTPTGGLRYLEREISCVSLPFDSCVLALLVRATLDAVDA